MRGHAIVAALCSSSAGLSLGAVIFSCKLSGQEARLLVLSAVLNLCAAAVNLWLVKPVEVAR